jgi:hypothetical protein
MKLFTKLALVSSMALSANAFAMQAMDDASLGATTGQDGITIAIDTTSGIQIDKLYIHDNDGSANNQLTFGTTQINTNGTEDAAVAAGAIAINGLNISKAASNTGNLATLKIDAADIAGQAVLNVLAETGALDVSIGSIGVASSGTYDADTNLRGVKAGTEKQIITGLSLSLGATKANVQLGNAPQGAMIVVDSEIVGGLSTSLTINDTSVADGGSIGIEGLKVTSAGSRNLNADVKIGVTKEGLNITPASSPINAYINKLTLGESTKAIGSIEVQGLNLGGTSIKISGH